MIVEVKEVPHRRHKTVMRKVIVKKCDQCGKLEDVGFKQHLLDGKIHFCSKDCMNKAAQAGGILQLKKVETSLEKFGTKHPLQSNEVKEQIRQTNKQRHGVEWFTQSSEFKGKMKETMMAKYGVEYTLQATAIKNKARQTKLKRYGHICNMAAPGIKETFDRQEMSRKGHETKKKNGTYTVSKAEQLFYQLLIQTFGKDNIEHPCIINRWQIDFFVRSLNVYIQFDGVYWHGLDRLPEEIKCFRTPRDETIYETLQRDRRQDDWFRRNGKILVRITDLEFKELGCDVIPLIDDRAELINKVLERP